MPARSLREVNPCGHLSLSDADDGYHVGPGGWACGEGSFAWQGARWDPVLGSNMWRLQNVSGRTAAALQRVPRNCAQHPMCMVRQGAAQEVVLSLPGPAPEEEALAFLDVCRRE